MPLHLWFILQFDVLLVISIHNAGFWIHPMVKGVLDHEWPCSGSILVCVWVKTSPWIQGRMNNDEEWYAERIEQRIVKCSPSQMWSSSGIPCLDDV